MGRYITDIEFYTFFPSDGSHHRIRNSLPFVLPLVNWVHCSVKGTCSYNFTGMADPLPTAVCQVIISFDSKWKVCHSKNLSNLPFFSEVTKTYTSSWSSETLVSSPSVCHQPYTLHCISFWSSHCSGFYFSSNTYGKGAFGPQKSFLFWNISEFMIGKLN